MNEELNAIYKEKQKQLEYIKSQSEKINKPIIYSEGYNFKYLERAKKVFLDEIDMDVKNCGGKNELQKLFKLFAKTGFDRFNIFFIFDCDASGQFDDCNLIRSNTLIPYVFKKNPDNQISEIQSGIENLFNQDVVELKSESELFSITTVNKDGVILSRERKLRKENFEKYFLEERNEDSDFEKFQDLFNLIALKINSAT